MAETYVSILPHFTNSLLSLWLVSEFSSIWDFMMMKDKFQLGRSVLFSISPNKPFYEQNPRLGSQRSRARGMREQFLVDDIDKFVKHVTWSPLENAPPDTLRETLMATEKCWQNASCHLEKSKYSSRRLHIHDVCLNWTIHVEFRSHE